MRARVRVGAHADEALVVRHEQRRHVLNRAVRIIIPYTDSDTVHNDENAVLSALRDSLPAPDSDIMAFAHNLGMSSLAGALEAVISCSESRDTTDYVYTDNAVKSARKRLKDVQLLARTTAPAEAHDPIGTGLASFAVCDAKSLVLRCTRQAYTVFGVAGKPSAAGAHAREPKTRKQAFVLRHELPSSAERGETTKVGHPGKSAGSNGKKSSGRQQSGSVERWMAGLKRLGCGEALLCGSDVSWDLLSQLDSGGAWRRRQCDNSWVILEQIRQPPIAAVVSAVAQRAGIVERTESLAAAAAPVAAAASSPSPSFVSSSVPVVPGPIFPSATAAPAVIDLTQAEDISDGVDALLDWLGLVALATPAGRVVVENNDPAIYTQRQRDFAASALASITAVRSAHPFVFSYDPLAVFAELQPDSCSMTSLLCTTSAGMVSPSAIDAHLASASVLVSSGLVPFAFVIIHGFENAPVSWMPHERGGNALFGGENDTVIVLTKDAWLEISFVAEDDTFS